MDGRALIRRRARGRGVVAWRVSRVLLAILLIVGLSACEGEDEPTVRLQVGDVLPPLPLVDLRNQPQTLRPSPGKLLILNVWATWCGPCRQELPSLQRLMDKLVPADFELVLLSVDDDAHLVREFLIERNMHFTSLLDLDMSVSGKVLGIRVFPSTYFVRDDGRIVSLIEGAREWDSAEVLAEIKSLQIPEVEPQP